MNNFAEKMYEGVQVRCCSPDRCECIARMFSEEVFEGLKPPSCKHHVEKNSNKMKCTPLFTVIKLLIVSLM
jgi:hypothetical protein